MVNCNIRLDNNARAVYTAGELLKGTIELHIDHPKKFRGLYFKVYGFARCHWTERRTRTTGSGKNRKTTSYTVYYEGKDVYLNTKTYLFGHDGAPAVEVPSGTHRYDFALQLPPMLPASFEASKGHIRYEIESVLDIPWSFDKEFKLQFTVARNDDLSLDSQLKIPVQMEEIQTFCCLFCQSQPMMMTVSIPRTGFAAGESIPININYVNKSDVAADRTKINLKRIIRYTSQTPHCKTKVEEEKMVEIYVEGVKAESNTSYQKNLSLPHVLMASNNRYCNVVQITYELKVEAITSGCGGNPTIKFPITIGTFSVSPVQTNFPASAPAISYPASSPETNYPPSAPIMLPSATVPVPFPKSELPPPSFDEAIKMGSKQVEASGSQQPPSAPGWNLSSEPSAPVAPMAPPEI